MKRPPFCLSSMIGRRLAGEQYAPDGYTIGVNNKSGGRAERDAPAFACDSPVCWGYGGAKGRGERGDPGEAGGLRKEVDFAGL